MGQDREGAGNQSGLGTRLLAADAAAVYQLRSPHVSASDNTRLPPDQVLLDIARYVDEFEVSGAKTYSAAQYCLMDALGCAIEGLGAPDCVKLLGPLVPGTVVPHGARVPGTQFELDPVTAAFNISCALRWLDFNDTWWAGGHPSDSIGGILAVADHLSRRNTAAGKRPFTMREVMAFMVKAYEINGMLAIDNRFDHAGVGLDSTMLMKIAATPVITKMMGGSRDEIVNALSHAFIDGFSLNLYRLNPTSGSRKSWAAADACARAVELAMRSVKGEMGYPSALTAKIWGFQDVLFRGREYKPPGALGSHVIENVQFKIGQPGQRHAQTAIECAIRLHPLVKERLEDIERVVIETHAEAMSKIVAAGALPNYAARDHCMQYIVAVALIHGALTAASYEDEFAADPRIDALRSKIHVKEEPSYTRSYREEQSNANALQIFFRDGSSTDKVEVLYLIGDARRRIEGIPLLVTKFRDNLARRYPPKQQAAIIALFDDAQCLQGMPVDDFMTRLAI